VLATRESKGWRFVAFVRLVPLFPFNLLNYSLGLTRTPPGVARSKCSASPMAFEIYAPVASEAS
jgi:hypothetical protein